jgi:hypothetical protein
MRMRGMRTTKNVRRRWSTLTCVRLGKQVPAYHGLMLSFSSSQELIGLNKTADKLLSLTDPIHPIISAFLVIALNELVAGKKSRLSEEMEDTLDAVRMFLKGVVLEGETEGRVVPDGSKMEMGMDEKALERRWHEGTCPNCRKRVLLESKKKRKCTGAARELEDRILAAGLHCGR